MYGYTCSPLKYYQWGDITRYHFWTGNSTPGTSAEKVNSRQVKVSSWWEHCSLCWVLFLKKTKADEQSSKASLIPHSSTPLAQIAATWVILHHRVFRLPQWLSRKRICLQCRRYGNWGLIPGSGRSPGKGNGNPHDGHDFLHIISGSLTTLGWD